MKSIPGTRAPRLPRNVRTQINKRAFLIAAELYARYRAELEAVIAEGAVELNDIGNWRPSDQRASNEVKHGYGS